MVPAPTSTSSGCCNAHPRDAQNSDSFRIRFWNVTTLSMEKNTERVGKQSGNPPQRHRDTGTPGEPRCGQCFPVSLCLCGSCLVVFSRTSVSSSAGDITQNANRFQILF